MSFFGQVTCIISIIYSAFLVFAFSMSIWKERSLKQEMLKGEKKFKKACLQVKNYRKRVVKKLSGEIVILVLLLFGTQVSNFLFDVFWEKSYENDPAEYLVGEKSSDAYTKNEEYKYGQLFWDLDVSLAVIDKDIIKKYENTIELKMDVVGESLDPELIDENANTDYARLDEIQKQVLGYASKQNVPYTLFKEEADIRKSAYSEHPSSVNAYQTARASDDAVDSITREFYKRKLEDAEIEELSLAAADAVAYYVEYVKYASFENLTLNDTCYKLGLIFEKLRKLSVYTEEQKKEFLLSSRAFLKMCQKYTDKDTCCLRDADYYIGYNLYELGMGIEDDADKQEYLEQAQTYLGKYCASNKGKKKTADREANLKSANDLLIRLDDKLKQLDTSGNTANK